MRTLTSTIDDQLAANYADFEDTFGFGPCGAYAALRRKQGWGQIAVCTARAGQTEFPHYIIIDDGIIDMANPLDETLTYTDIDILDSDEMPELIDESVIAWLEARIS